MKLGIVVENQVSQSVKGGWFLYALFYTLEHPLNLLALG